MSGPVRLAPVTLLKVERDPSSPDKCVVNFTPPSNPPHQYEIHVKGSSPDQTFCINTKETSRSIENLALGETYRICVVSKMSDLLRSTASEVSFTIVPDKPSPPKSSALVCKSDVHLEWEPVYGATSYHVKWRKSATNYSEKDECETCETEFVLNGLDPCIQYKASIAAKNAAGCGKFSDEKTFCIAPAPPTDLQVELFASSAHNTIQIRFSNPNRRLTDSYQIKAVSLPSKKIRVEETKENHLLLDGLEPGEIYTVSVSILYKGLQSEDTTKSLQMRCAQVENIRTELHGDSTMMILWDETPCATSYKFSVKSQDHEYQPHTVETNQYFMSGVNPKNVYGVEVSAGNDAGFGKPTHKVINPGTPAPMDLKVSKSKDSPDTDLVVSWRTPYIKPDYYLVTPGNNTLPSAFKSSPAVFRLLKPGVKYQFSVQAVYDNVISPCIVSAPMYPDDEEDGPVVHLGPEALVPTDQQADEDMPGAGALLLLASQALTPQPAASMPLVPLGDQQVEKNYQFGGGTFEKANFGQQTFHITGNIGVTNIAQQDCRNSSPVDENVLHTGGSRERDAVAKPRMVTEQQSRGTIPKGKLSAERQEVIRHHQGDSEAMKAQHDIDESLEKLYQDNFLSCLPSILFAATEIMLLEEEQCLISINSTKKTYSDHERQLRFSMGDFVEEDIQDLTAVSLTLVCGPPDADLKNPVNITLPSWWDSPSPQDVTVMKKSRGSEYTYHSKGKLERRSISFRTEHFCTFAAWVKDEHIKDETIRVHALLCDKGDAFTIFIFPLLGCKEDLTNIKQKKDKGYRVHGVLDTIPVQLRDELVLSIDCNSDDQSLKVSPRERVVTINKQFFKSPRRSVGFNIELKPGAEMKVHELDFKISVAGKKEKPAVLPINYKRRSPEEYVTVICCFAESGSLHAYAPSMNIWTEMKNVLVAIERQKFVAVSFGSVTYLLTAGGDVYKLSGLGGSVPLTWVTKMKSSPDIAAALDGHLYVVTVEGFFMSLKNDSMKKVPKSLPPLPTNRLKSALVPGGKLLYCVGGSNGGKQLSVAECFNPNAKKWHTLPSMCIARSSAAGLEYDEKVFIAGGDGTHGPTTAIEYYDPLSDSWTTVGEKMVFGRRHFTVCLVDGLFFAVGGDRKNTVEARSPTKGPWKKVGEYPNGTVMHPTVPVVMDLLASSFHH